MQISKMIHGGQGHEVVMFECQEIKDQGHVNHYNEYRMQLLVWCLILVFVIT